MLNRLIGIGYTMYLCSYLRSIYHGWLVGWLVGWHIHIHIHTYTIPYLKPCSSIRRRIPQPTSQHICGSVGREIGRWLLICRTRSPSDHNKKTPKISLGNFKSNPPPLKKFFVFPDRIFLQHGGITQNLHIPDTTKKSRHLASVTKNVPSVSVVCRFGSL